MKRRTMMKRIMAHHLQGKRQSLRPQLSKRMRKKRVLKRMLQMTLQRILKTMRRTRRTEKCRFDYVSRRFGNIAVNLENVSPFVSVLNHWNNVQGAEFPSIQTSFECSCEAM
jgi:hypothetical protein